MLIKRLLDWNEEKFEELDGRKPKDVVKAFGSGMIDGFVDSAVVLFIPVLVSAYYWKNKAEKK